MTEAVYVNVINHVRWVSLKLLPLLVLSQVVPDSQFPDTGATLRVRGPLEFKCHLESTDGWFFM